MAKKITLIKILVSVATILAFAALVTFFLLGDNLRPAYFLGMLLTIPLGAAAVYLNILLDRHKKVALARDQWGKPVSRDRDFHQIDHYYRSTGTAPDKIQVDDHTCNDLDLHAFFFLVDRTLTCPGESVLYSMLRTPCTSQSASELLRRHQIASLLESNKATREKLQLILLKLGRSKANAITHLLWDELPAKPAGAVIYNLLALAAVLVLALPFLLGSRFFLIIPSLFAVNTSIHYKLRARFSHQISAIADLAGLLRAALANVGADLPGLEPEQQQIEAATASAHKILRKTRSLLADVSTGSDLYFFYEYLKILFLTDIRCFFATLDEIRRQIHELRESYRLIGSLDALLAVASYRQSLDYVEPEFIASEKSLKAVNIRHPLLNNPTPNSIEIQHKGILITGSNMAGKSTFLRTLGLNAIMAQSIYTCLAQAYTASYLQPVTSINKLDDIKESKSLYFAEAERLRNVIAPSYTQVPGLCLIDELLSGTNYVERIAASQAILNYLRGKKALVVVATHDLDLADKLQDAYTCYHFSDKIDDKNLHFDYKLKPGIATTRNAIKLLEHLGYPPGIIQEANNNLH